VNTPSELSGQPTFHGRAVKIIKRIPRGRVATYGQIAALAGNPRAARMVVRVLHACSEKERLPWHRVINSRGTISLKRHEGYELQKAMLTDEGIEFADGDRIDLKRYLWKPRLVR